MDVKIPTLNEPERMDLEGGGHLLVRRVRRSVVTKIIRDVDAADTSAMSDSEAALFTMRLFQAGVVGGEGVVDHETGDAVKVGFDQHPVIGRICADAIYDAVTEQDAVRVIRIASPPQEPEVEQGK
jgi:hypothetical protein